MHELATTDPTGWITAGVAVVALVLNMTLGAMRFEGRMSKIEQGQKDIKADVDELLRKAKKRRSTDWSDPGPT